MPGLTDAYEDLVLQYSFGTAALAFPTNIYIALCSADPTDGGSTASELGRHLLVTAFDAAAAGVIQNTSVESIDTTGYTADTARYIAVVDTATLGTYRWTAQLTNPITFTPGETLEIPAGGFIFRLTNFAGTNASVNLRNKMLDHLFGKTEWTLSGTSQVWLHIGDPGVDGTANEFTGGGYLRQTITVGAPDTVANARRVRNSNAIQYLSMPAGTLSWWTVHRGTDYLYAYDQTDTAVGDGATVDIPINRLEFLVS